MIPTLETNTFQVRKEYLDQYHSLEIQSKCKATEEEPGPFALLAVAEGNKPRNRYNNILPYQENIFRFQNPHRYFNASRVLQGRAISCQGPLDDEHAHFWKMVWESRTTAVIMLTDLVEKNYLKCSWYLPQGTGETLPTTRELPKGQEITVTQVDGPPQPSDESSQSSQLTQSSESVGNPPKLIERRLELAYNGKQRTVIHYHLTGWGDFCTVPEVILAQLVMLVWERHFSQGEHIISHCSAGIGRSGTFLATLETYSQLIKMPIFTTDMVLNIVKQLRSFENGRVNMVQTVDQYGLIFKTLAILNTHCAPCFCTQASL
jgi:protein tyrosine phosphatase